MAIEDFAGFGVKGYRSYGTSLQNVGPMSKVHLIAGKNNVGKSNLLRALQFILMHVAVSRQPQLSQLFPHGRDTPEGWNPVNTRAVAIGINLNGNLRSLFRIPDTDDDPSLLRLFSTEPFTKGHRDVVWFEFDVIPDLANNTTNIVPSREQFEAGLMQARGMDEMWLRNFTLSNFHQAGGAYDNWRTILQQWDVWSLAPKLEWIDAKRSVGASDAVRDGDSVESSFRHGRGFIPQLQTLQSPETENQRRDRPKFEALENLVQSVLEDPQARIAVSASGTDLQITTGGKFESYKDLGTGLTEVVQIAAMATSVSGYVISIEEPEIHLHPTLQRLLVTYLAEKTDNHYVISTHSASMLDAEVASISHVSLDEDGWSVVSPVALRRERASVVADLGNRASDLVQSNYVIWVEGPSDRLYVSHWIQQVAPELLEGANFSIMFYGGGLLNHLTADDDNEVTSFIELAQINRNFAVIIDSDISRRSQTINATKQRVVDELTAAGGVSWITNGYTIENYIPDELLEGSIQEAYPNKRYLLTSSQYKSPLGKVFQGETVKPNKVTVARKVVATGMPINSWSPHLSDQISKLVEAIKDANGLS